MTFNKIYRMTFEMTPDMTSDNTFYMKTDDIQQNI